MTQVVATDPEAKKVVLGVTVDLRDASNKPRIGFRMSAAAYRQAGVAIKIDDHKPIRAPFGQCDANLCEVQALVENDVLSWLKAGKLMQLAYFLDKERQATFPVSLNGFDQALTTLRQTR